MAILSERIASYSSFGLTWWKWSALYAAIIGGSELLVLTGFAAFGRVEFAVLGMYFVVAATCVALPATALVILVWLLLVSIAPVLKTNRSWVVVYVFVISWPLYFGPISLYELALAAPTVLGFVLPRFLVSNLRSPEIYEF